MALRIFTNLSSLNSQRAMQINNARLGSSLERIASGIRLQRSSDDIAAMSVSNALHGDAVALRQGAKNLADGFSLINTADGAISEQASILIRLREITSQAATGTIGDTERAAVNMEFTALRAEFDRIAATSEFNGRKLLDGSLSSGSSDTMVIQLGLDSSDNNRFNLNTEINLSATTSSNLGFGTNSIITETAALTAMSNLIEAIEKLSAIRGRIGAVQERLQYAKDHLNSTVENLTGAISTMRDADFAEEFAGLTRNQILVQGAAAMIGQANLIPQSVLTLLQEQ
ncbi:MAG TPA: flagellin FliC [Nitrospinaceae bacterium]|nr:flagellin FliC [Nitrospinaceae bacterium]